MSVYDITVSILAEPKDPIILIILWMQYKYLNLVDLQWVKTGYLM